MATFAQPPAQPIVKLSKLVKEARELGCETFSSTVDIFAVNNLLKRGSDTLTDMELDDELKLRVATRLIDKSATNWWDNLKLRSTAPVAWDLFVQEFNEQYYTHFHQDQKRQEFFKLKLFGKSVAEYENELRELLEFVPELANFDEYLCSKFKEGLSLEIREKMSVTRSQSYKEVVQLALRVEKLTGERMSQSNFQKRKGFGFMSSQLSKKCRSSESSGYSFGFGFGSFISPQSI